MLTDAHGSACFRLYSDLQWRHVLQQHTCLQKAEARLRPRDVSLMWGEVLRGVTSSHALCFMRSLVCGKARNGKEACPDRPAHPAWAQCMNTLTMRVGRGWTPFLSTIHARIDRPTSFQRSLGLHTMSSSLCCTACDSLDDMSPECWPYLMEQPGSHDRLMKYERSYDCGAPTGPSSISQYATLALGQLSNLPHLAAQLLMAVRPARKAPSEGSAGEALDHIG